MPSFWISPLDADAKERLRQVGAKVPRRIAKSAAPTLADLKRVLESLSGCMVEYLPDPPRAGEPWQAHLQGKKKSRSGPHLLITAAQYPGDGKPLPVIYAEAGTLEAAIAVTVGLAQDCGLLVLDGEDSYGPHLVEPDTQPGALMESMTRFAEEQLEDVPEEWRNS